MKVVADSSPLIVLAKLGVFDLLPRLYPHVFISAAVYAEVVVAGSGLPGAANVAKAKWIEVKPIRNPADLAAAQAKFGIGAGELSTIILAKEVTLNWRSWTTCERGDWRGRKGSKFAAWLVFSNSFTDVATSPIFAQLSSSY